MSECARACVRVHNAGRSLPSSALRIHVSMATPPTEQMREERKSGHAGAMADARQRECARRLRL